MSRLAVVPQVEDAFHTRAKRVARLKHRRKLWLKVHFYLGLFAGSVLPSHLQGRLGVEIDPGAVAEHDGPPLALCSAIDGFPPSNRNACKVAIRMTFGAAQAILRRSWPAPK